MVITMTHQRLHRIEELNLKQVRVLKRERTAVLIPMGMVEEHGDHLPLGTDNYAVEALVLAAASWLLDHDKSLHIVLMPLLPFGTDPVDTRRSDLFQDAGSIWISASTLKLLLTEIAEQVLRYGFKHIFPVNFHGGAGQSIAVDEVCADIRSRYPGVTMYEPIGYVMAGATLDVTPGLATLLGRPLTASEEVALKGSVHASMFETSVMLNLRPELVDPLYKSLRTIEWHQVYHMENWPGYVGAGPAHANAEVGGAVLRWRGVRAAALIRQAMEGADLSGLPRHPVWMTPDQGAESVTEAPGEVELPSRDPQVDSKPEMYFPREKLAEARAEAAARSNQAAGKGSEEPVDPDKLPPQSEETRPSASHRTQMRTPKRPAEPD